MKQVASEERELIQNINLLSRVAHILSTDSRSNYDSFVGRSHKCSARMFMPILLACHIT